MGWWKRWERVDDSVLVQGGMAVQAKCGADSVQ
jgi:hypothetical protein